MGGRTGKERSLKERSELGLKKEEEETRSKIRSGIWREERLYEEEVKSDRSRVSRERNRDRSRGKGEGGTESDGEIQR